MEIHSPGHEDHDLVTKRREYAAAGISEYWLLDPDAETITVLKLQGKKYRVHGEFAQGETAASVLLPGFQVAVKDVFDHRV